MTKEEDLKQLLDRYPLTPPPPRHRYEYGTAGFRYESQYLPALFLRMGMFAAVRSASCNGEAVGIMCTASHNPVRDNGMKLIDPSGDMLDSSWEGSAETSANASSTEDFLEELRKLARSHAWMELENPPPMRLHVGRDTRPHSLHLIELVMQGGRMLGAHIEDEGIVTTPQLHTIVLHSNLPNGIPSEDGYWDTLLSAYLKLLNTGKGKKREWVVDCACGVAYPKIQRLNQWLQSHPSHRIPTFIPVNPDSDTDNLNHLCGSEYVQKHQSPPAIHHTHPPPSPYRCSMDGDADRIVFYSSPEFTLLDGDRIAALVALFIQEELECLVIEGVGLGVVQTAYANGSSTSFLKKRNLQVEMVKTGVKHLHHKARSMDIGIYFEANGHGTVLFQPKFFSCLSNQAPNTPRQQLAMQRLTQLPKLVNQTVGDAISDLLLVDVILCLWDWDFGTWRDLYRDLPSRQLKVVVRDRTIITTNDDETRALSPPDLQPALDALMKEFGPPARCFVRPSGTENAVRVYAEAKTQRDADALARETCEKVYELCGGVGDFPWMRSGL